MGKKKAQAYETLAEVRVLTRTTPINGFRPSSTCGPPIQAQLYTKRPDPISLNPQVSNIIKIPTPVEMEKKRPLKVGPPQDTWT